MSFLLRLCLGLLILVPAVANAQLSSVLEIPSNGDQLSGIGVISGWKCEAAGDITVQVGEAAPLPTLYGLARGDTSSVCGDDGDNGFVTYFNWATLPDGEHTVRAYDNGVEFAENTVTVTRAGKEFLTNASDKPIRVPDFPAPGETTTFQWNRSTQHLEMTMWTQPTDLGTCVEALTVGTEEQCSGTVSIGGTRGSYTFTVDMDGQACISTSFNIGSINGCFTSLPDAVNEQLGVTAIKNPDGSWTISIAEDPVRVDLGSCTVGLTVAQGESCSGSILGTSFTFFVDTNGQGCVESALVNQCYASDIDLLGASGSRNDDGSWTIRTLP